MTLTENQIKYGQIMEVNFTIINLRNFSKKMALKCIQLLMKENQLLQKDLSRL